MKPSLPGFLFLVSTLPSLTVSGAHIHHEDSGEVIGKRTSLCPTSNSSSASLASATRTAALPGEPHGSKLGSYIYHALGASDSSSSSSSTIATPCPCAATAHPSIQGDSSTLSSNPEPTGRKLALKRDWRIKAGEYENLKAEKRCKMMYTDDSVKIGNKPAFRTPITWLTMPNMKLPTVQLQNSDRLHSVVCQKGDDGPRQIQMHFNDKGAYDYAWNNWHKQVRPTGDYLLITEAEGCWDGPDSTQERRFLRAKSETKDDQAMSITCEVESVPFQDTVDENALNDLEFSSFDPANEASGVKIGNDAPGASAPENGTDTTTPLRDPSGDSNFDKNLDRQIGILDLETMNATFVQYNFTLDDFFGESDLPNPASTPLQKRKIGDRLKKLAKKIKSGIEKAAKVVVDGLKQAGDAIVDFAKEVGEKLNDFFTFDRSFDKDVSFDTTNNAGFVETPFDGLRGVKLLEFTSQEGGANVQIFCVECGASGDFEIQGALKFSIGNGLETAEIGVKGNLEAALQFGFLGSLSLVGTHNTRQETKDFEKRIVTLPLSPFSVPGILIIGPSASMSTGFDMTFDASGKLLAGAVATWGNIDALLDLKNAGNNKANGFTPDITPVFEADGNISISTGVFLEVKISVGIDVLNGKFEASGGLANKPRLGITAATEASSSATNGTQFTGDCKGVSISIGFTDEVSAELTLGDLEKSFPITTFKGPSFDTCVKIGPQKRGIESKRAKSFPSPPASLGNITFTGGIYTSMGTNDGSVHVRYSPNGNLYAVPETKVPTNVKNKEWSGWFTSDESGSITIGDSLGRVLHGYLDTIRKDGVSRLRLHKPDEIPKTAWPVVFAAVFPDGETPQTIASQNPDLVLADPVGNVYVPVVCVYERDGVYPKLFIANGTDNGIGTLMGNSAEIVANVTGERVKRCGPISLTNWRTGQDISVAK